MELVCDEYPSVGGAFLRGRVGEIKVYFSSDPNEGLKKGEEDKFGIGEGKVLGDFDC